MLLYGGLQPRMRALTQEDIDKAVLHTLETQVLPSQAAQAYEKIARSVVRVRDFATGENHKEIEAGVGTGVVIVDKGIILTNLHVVLGAKNVGVVFADGTGVRGHGHRRAAGERPRGAAGKTIPDDLDRGDAALDARPRPGDR